MSALLCNTSLVKLSSIKMGSKFQDFLHDENRDAKIRFNRFCDKGNRTTYAIGWMVVECKTISIRRSATWLEALKKLGMRTGSIFFCVEIGFEKTVMQRY